MTSVPPIRGTFRTDEDARAVYSESAGIMRVIPRAVAVPADASDACTLVRWAAETRSPLIPRGSGTSMACGAIGDGIVVDLSRMNEIGDVDAERKRIRVGPGALRGDVEKAARAVGLRFPPDPSSGAYCTIGGMVSTNAAGSHTLRYGATRWWVCALDCIFDDGSRATVERLAPPPSGVPALERLSSIDSTLREAGVRASEWHRGVKKDSSGYGVREYAKTGDVVDLLVGSEGTLALIVGVELALAEAPAATSSLLGAFATLEEAVAAAMQARKDGAAACELLDRTFLDVAGRGAILPRIPLGSEAVLLAAVEGSDAEEAAEGARVLASAFERHGATHVTLALDRVDEHELWALRHAASPILATLGPSLTSMQFIEDGAVPPEAFSAYVRGVRAILERHGITGVIFGHAGDAHVHVNPLIDMSRADWRSTMSLVLAEVVALTSSLHGTLAGEHGDGRLRTPLLGAVWPPEALETFAAVKHAFDPGGIFNPGVKVPLAWQQPINDVKYDPSLPHLPPRAAAVLASIARDRSYHKSRLDLLDQLP